MTIIAVPQGPGGTLATLRRIATAPALLFATTALGPVPALDSAGVMPGITPLGDDCCSDRPRALAGRYAPPAGWKYTACLLKYLQYLRSAETEVGIQSSSSRWVSRATTEPPRVSSGPVRR